MKRKEKLVLHFDKMGEPIIDPAPDKPPTWEDTIPAKAFFRGGNWGMLVGLVTVSYYMSNHIWLGPYSTDLVLLLAAGVGAGFVLGGFVGWLSAKITGKNNVPPTSLLD